MFRFNRREKSKCNARKKFEESKRKESSQLCLHQEQDLIPKQDKKNLGLKKDQCLTSDVPPCLPGMKSFRNKEHDDNPETTDTSYTNRDNMSNTIQYDYIVNVKYMKNTNDDDEYKEDTSKHHEGIETVNNHETSNTSRNGTQPKEKKY